MNRYTSIKEAIGAGKAKEIKAMSKRQLCDFAMNSAFRELMLEHQLEASSKDTACLEVQIAKSENSIQQAKIIIEAIVNKWSAYES